MKVLVAILKNSFLVTLVVLLFQGCTSFEAPDSLYSIEDIAITNLKSIENFQNLGTWYNRLYAMEESGLVPRELIEESKARLLAYLQINAGPAGGAEELSGLYREVLRQKNLGLLSNGAASDPSLASNFKELFATLPDASPFSNIVLGTHKPSLIPQSSAEALMATVTLVVDKGTRLVQGVGVPDRVIGSGFFIEESGLILTNYHVIRSEVDPKYKGSSTLTIRTTERPNDRVPARVLAWDETFDLALVQAAVSAPKILSLHDSLPSLPGTEVFALGSPGGLEASISRGIVSSTNRSLLPMSTVLQVDAAINPGNSGGPLVSGTGKFLGVVFAGIEQFEGVNFVIPAKTVGLIIPHLLLGGRVDLPWLGIQVYETTNMLRVSYVEPESPAWFAGVRQGDQIIGLNGSEFIDVNSLQDKILMYSPETVVRLKFRRGTGDLNSIPGGATIERTLFTGKREANFLEPFVKAGFHKNIMVPLFGLALDQLAPSFWGPQYVVNAVIPGSQGDEAGFEPGDRFRVIDFGHEEDPEGTYSLAWIQMGVEMRERAFTLSSLQLAVLLPVSGFL